MTRTSILLAGCAAVIIGSAIVNITTAYSDTEAPTGRSGSPDVAEAEAGHAHKSSRLDFHDRGLLRVNDPLHASEKNQTPADHQFCQGRESNIEEAFLAVAVAAVAFSVGVALCWIGSRCDALGFRIAASALGLIAVLAAPFVGILWTYRLFHGNWGLFLFAAFAPLTMLPHALGIGI